MSALLLDSNVWVAATLPRHPGHPLAQSVLNQATAAAPAVFCRATQLSFLRLVTTSTLQKTYQATAFGNREALASLQILLALPQVAERSEPAGVGPLWFRWAARETASPKVWMDAYLAAFAIHENLEFVTFDGDFQGYQGAGLRLRLLATPPSG